MRKRLVMRKVRKALTGPMFTGSVVGLLAFFVTFNLVWVSTKLDFLHVCAFGFFGGLFAWVGYLMLVEGPRDKYYRVHNE